MNRIEKKFKELRKKKKKAFIAFVTAGYPDLRATEKLITAFSGIGVDILELGIPFSDPVADGPVIQEASQAALKKKTTLNDILDIVKKARNYTDMPICLMSYYNPIFCFGEEKFVRSANECGVDGVIIPDLPPEEASSLIRLSAGTGLCPIFFIAPTTTLKRIKLISRVSKGFIYYVSLTGVTGARRDIPEDLINDLRMVKRRVKKPVCVGFGLSRPEHVKQIQKIADGVIVGSAIIKEIKRNIDKPDLIKRVSGFVRRLKDV